MYNSSYACLSFSNTATFNINCGKLDYWSTSPTLISTGVIENNPLYSWYKSNEEDLSIVASVTSSRTTISSNTFTETELQTLPDSLVFIDDNQKITLLSKEPTLVYSGTPNEGTTKITSISWAVDTGILFKVNEPLYNGETYSTLINWILTSEILE